MYLPSTEYCNNSIGIREFAQLASAHLPCVPSLIYTDVRTDLSFDEWFRIHPSLAFVKLAAAEFKQIEMQHQDTAAVMTANNCEDAARYTFDM